MEAGTFLKFFLALMSACSGGHGGGDGRPPPEPDPKPATYVVDVDALRVTNDALRSESGKEPAWTFRVVVAGSEKIRLNSVAFEVVAGATKELQLKSGNTARVEMTVTAAESPSSLLATNLADAISTDQHLKSIWAARCGNVNPDLALDEKPGHPPMGAVGTGSIKVELKVCDLFHPARSFGPSKP